VSDAFPRSARRVVSLMSTYSIILAVEEASTVQAIKLQFSPWSERLLFRLRDSGMEDQGRTRSKEQREGMLGTRSTSSEILLGSRDKFLNANNLVLLATPFAFKMLPIVILTSPPLPSTLSHPPETH
jgi:hypothetical protein